MSEDRVTYDYTMEEMDAELEEFNSIEKQVGEALKNGIADDADVRMVQSILLTKIVEVAMSMGMSEEKFMERTRATWQLVEWNKEEFNDEQVH
jgi:hypothetical protein|tara:strand:- start:191 stop:469 length:279 start_codon:yes stop_codon:yes gene_type:complete